ncbi:hypothetical protein NON27_28140, partial [Vibrio parahaemolyticus]|nr:hypothetical protein [Vibrio parahaemolyticus]
TKSGAEQLKDALPGITTSVNTTIQSISQVATSIDSFTASVDQAIADNQLTEEEKGNLLKLLDNLYNSLPAQQQAIDQLITFLTQLQNQT